MSVQSVDPRTGEAFGAPFADTTAQELDRLARTAAAAAPVWAATSGEQRAASLRAVADSLDAHAGRLAEIADRETGLGLPRLTGEVARSTFQLRMFAEFVESGQHLAVVIDREVPGPPPAGHPDLRRMNVAVGPVAVYGASNFPFAFSVPGGDTASALAAGCPVIIKAHPSHPATSTEVAALIVAALTSAGAPEGTFAIVHGMGAGRSLVEHPAIRAASFTGSPAGGRALAALAAGRPDPIPFYGELGSVNPVIVTPEGVARASDFAVQYVDSLTLGAGQFCTNPGLLFVPAGSGLRDQIVAQAAERAAMVMLHGGVLELFEQELAGLSDLPGVAVLVEAHRVSDAGFSTSPAILAATAATALAHRALLHTECFGPAGVIVEYETADELLALVDALDGSLVATIHGQESEELSAALVARLAHTTGRIVWGGWPTGVAVSPAQHHGGPHPVTTNSLHTSVGTAAINRFLRPVAFQTVPQHLLPAEVRD